MLVDAVASGAAVSFLETLTPAQAIDWWAGVVRTADERAALLVARAGDSIVGTVQVHPAWAPNQPHRGDVTKLIVHRAHRRAGLGARLMQAAEDDARRAGFRLLTLDAKRGADAEGLYRRLGWTYVGVVPRYALDPDGTHHDAVFYYKELAK